MPAKCTFILNGKHVSVFSCPGFGSVTAFSGNGRHVDDPGSTALKGKGPIPKGRYTIVARRRGGHLGPLRDAIKDLWSHSDRATWFSLYRQDGKIDDETTVAGVRRDAFRLHPRGRWGISDGCITLTSQARFDSLRAYLLAQDRKRIPGTHIIYYGTVDVR